MKLVNIINGQILEKVNSNQTLLNLIEATQTDEDRIVLLEIIQMNISTIEFMLEHLKQELQKYYRDKEEKEEQKREEIEEREKTEEKKEEKKKKKKTKEKKLPF